MPEGFRSLAAALRAPAETDRFEPRIEIVEEDAEHSTELACAESNLLRDVRLFHARIMEAVESAVERLLCDVACDVLARELQIRPPDIVCIVNRALQRYVAEQPLRVRVHPDDAPTLQCSVPAIADAGLARGDAIIELRDGFIDASFGVRLDAVLRASAA